MTPLERLAQVARDRSDRRGESARLADAYDENERWEEARERDFSRDIDEAETQARYDDRDWKENHT